MYVLLYRKWMSQCLSALNDPQHETHVPSSQTRSDSVLNLSLEPGPIHSNSYSRPRPAHPPTPLFTLCWDKSVTWDTSARHQPIRGSARIRTRRPRPFRENVMIVWKVHAVGRSASCKIKWTGKKSSIFVMYCTCIVFVKRKSTRFTGRRSCPMKNNEQNRKKLRKNKPGRTQEKQIRFYIKVFAYSMALSG